MRKIIDFIIRLLGGYTKKDAFDLYAVGRLTGERDAAAAIRSEMDDVYGKSADNWCKHLYCFVTNRWEIYHNRLEENCKRDGFRRFVKAYDYE